MAALNKTVLVRVGNEVWVIYVRLMNCQISIKGVRVIPILLICSKYSKENAV
jgi:hypothetical protein